MFDCRSFGNSRKVLTIYDSNRKNLSRLTVKAIKSLLNLDTFLARSESNHIVTTFPMYCDNFPYRETIQQTKQLLCFGNRS